jgi:sec-independent protein translocase protein TatA
MPLLAVTFGLFNLGGGEILLLLALFLILLGAKKLPELGKGLSDGIFKFGKAVDDESAEAGRSLGGIYGKPAAEALTVDNEVAELYDPAVFQNDAPQLRRRRRWIKAFSKAWQWLLRFLRFNVSTI